MVAPARCPVFGGHERGPFAYPRVLSGRSDFKVRTELCSSGDLRSSEVIGRPLAVMMSNDGAEVLSFDEYGPLKFVAAKPEEFTISREEALARSDIVITGVPSDAFHPIQAAEIQASSIGINFSSVPNFSDAAADKTSLFIPRVGPMTVAMCMRNTLRLFSHFHEQSRDE